MHSPVRLERVIPILDSPANASERTIWTPGAAYPTGFIFILTLRFGVNIASYPQNTTSFTRGQASSVTISHLCNVDVSQSSRQITKQLDLDLPKDGIVTAAEQRFQTGPVKVWLVDPAA
ncbi:hypothetical protein LshimejAT787_0804010 [Lyophyllum shimeji]|uniref:Uncharacterized protein n=1 Tax=Lyophyllum shimeji TaxID=47721 RepID=A0A9P3PQ14_LYOSH|nr:hypothetical protein LshimejAT787_0804010 [Lyophyllum shimeji]